MHTGRIGHQNNLPKGAVVMAPSAVRAAGQMYTDSEGLKDHPVPQAMTEVDIMGTTAEFVNAATNAVKAGFDGIELHGANGYLLEQFIRPNSNTRTDQYGGSIENRARFVLEVMGRLVGVWGEGRVGIRLSPTLAYNGMVDSDPLATFSYLIEQLNALPLAYLHLMRATPDADRFPSWPRDTVATFGPLYRGNLLVNGGYDRDSAETVVSSGAAAAVSFGAPYVSNPDLVRRFELGSELAAPDRNTFYHGGEKGYVDYPALEAAPQKVAKGYWLVQATVVDPIQFGKYTAVAGPVLASYGGRVLARGDVAEVVEGSVPRRPYFVEFPSYAVARACFHSAAYQEAIALRAGAAHFDIVIVEGMGA